MISDDSPQDPLDILRLRAERPRDWWARVATGDGLARAIGYAVATGRLGEVRERLATRGPEDASTGVDPDFLRWRTIARAMVACGAVAAREPGGLVDLADLCATTLDSDALQRTAASVETDRWPAFVRERLDRLAWPPPFSAPSAWDLIARFMACRVEASGELIVGAGRPVVATSRIGVLLVTTAERRGPRMELLREEDGAVATLRIEALTDAGEGRLYADPWMHPFLHDDPRLPRAKDVPPTPETPTTIEFHRAIEHAVASVRALGLWADSFSLDLRWTLTLRTGEPLPPIGGPSAGLAYALGLAKVLADAQPELIPPVAVALRRVALGGIAATAKLTGESGLVAIGGVFEKLVKAARERSLPPIRTVLIASEQPNIPPDLKQFPNTTIRIAPGEDFQVEGVATLADAIACLDRRSPLAVGLRAYLQAHVDLRVGPRPLFARRGGTPETMYVEPAVARWNPAQQPASAEDEVRGTFARREEVRDRPPWRDLQEQIRRAVVLGRPGEGKTALTQMTARRVAQAGLTALDSGTQAPEDVAVPIWLRARDVAEAGSVAAAAVRGTAQVVTAALTRARLDTASAELAAAHIAAALMRASTWIFVDALDERDAKADLRAALADLVGVEGRVVLTCREYAYRRDTLLPFDLDDPTVVEYALQPLTRAQQAAFILAQWFRDDPARGRQVLERVVGHPQFHDLATNPLLLTFICATAADRTRAFDETTRRVHLYEWTLRDMVAGEHKKGGVGAGDDTQADGEDDDADEADEGSAPADEDDLEERLAVLERAAWIVFAAQPGDSPFSVQALKDAVTQACDRERVAEPDLFRTNLTRDLRRVGLLVSAGRDRMFLHRTFFEYLAAAGLEREGTVRIIEMFVAHVSDPTWREMLLFTVGVATLRDAARAGQVVEQVLERAPGPPGAAVALVSDAIAEAEVDTVATSPGGTGVPAATRAHLIRKLLWTIRNDEWVAVRTRVEAGRALGRLGDPRFRADLWWLPDDGRLGFLEVPAGRFTIGSDASDAWARDNERPSWEVSLPAYYLAKYPVTVAQFRAFVDDKAQNGGFVAKDPRCLDGVSNEPVVWVSWREAVRYCAWLNSRLEICVFPSNAAADLRRLLSRLRGDGGERPWIVTLPSEAEWERAARGLDGRIYPWTGKELDPNLANLSIAGAGGVSAVGCFPGGRSPCGAEDLLGNVWEYTRSLFYSYPYTPRDGRESLRDDHVDPVMRGASCWANYSNKCARAAYRVPENRDFRSFDIGFRVVVAPFFSEV